MGAVNFHRDFSADFAKIAAPLEECRQIQGDIDWTEERVKAFDELRQLFAANLLLRMWTGTKCFT